MKIYEKIEETLEKGVIVMMPGPTLVYKCSNCGKFTTKGSLLSGNTFGAKLYSDGNQIAPMLPEFPFIIKCKKCSSFYWLKDENKISEYGFDNNGSEWKEADKAEFLTLNEYQEAIDKIIYKDKEEEKYIRLKYWWAFNDKFRENRVYEFIENEQTVHEENCLKLIGLLNENKINEKNNDC